MKKSKEDILDIIETKVNDSNLNSAWESISTIIEKTFDDCGETGLDLFEIIGDYIDDINRKSMYVENVKSKETAKRYYQIEFESHDENEGYLIDSRYPIIEQNINGTDVDMVHFSIVQKLREMAYMGYVLRQQKEWKEKEVK